MSLHLYLGCMFAEKTTELMREIKRALFCGKKCLLITYAKDTRYNKPADLKNSTEKLEIVSHEHPILNTRQSIESGTNIDIMSCELIGSIYDKIIERKYELVAIDEAQFYNDAYEYAGNFIKLGINVFASGLDGNIQQKPFQVISDLISLSDSYTKLFAICMICKENNAIHTKKINVNPDEEYKDEIGGADKYYVVCRKCSLHNN